jgi:hypothetical protein
MKKLFCLLTLCALATAATAQTVIFSSDMSLAEAANFTVVGSPDTSAVFGYDWTAVPGAAGTGHVTIPASPNGDTIGLKLEANGTDDPTQDFEEALTVYCNTLSPLTGRYDVECDVFIAYPVPLQGGGTGSTQSTGMTIQASGTKINVVRNDALDFVDPATAGAVELDGSTLPGIDYVDSDGLVFGYTGDSGESTVTSSDFYLLDKDARTLQNGASTLATNLDGQVGTWTFGASALPSIGRFQCETNTTFSYPVGRTTAITDCVGAEPATAGWIWNTIKAEVRDSTVKFYVNDVLMVTTTSSKADRSVGVLLGDYFLSVASPLAESFTLFDNFTITEFPLPSAAEAGWHLYE